MEKSELLAQVREQIKALEEELESMEFQPDYSSLGALEESIVDSKFKKHDLQFELRKKKDVEQHLVRELNRRR